MGNFGRSPEELAAAAFYHLPGSKAGLEER